MMKRFAYFATFLLLLGLAACKGPAPKGNDYIVAAYIWPSCHDDSLGRALVWPAGKGEWEIIERGKPLFPGHYQPRQPLWGQEPDDDPAVVERWIDTALAHGVNTFIYDWYWFHHYPFLEGALDDGFLKARNNRKMNFFIMYANHEVTRYWNPYINDDDNTLTMDPRIDWDQWKLILQRVIGQYFHLPNYLKIDGKPVFGLYSPHFFVESFGSPEEAGRAMDYLREQVRAAGFPGIYLTQHSGMHAFPDPYYENKTRVQAEALGIDAFAFYNMTSRSEDYLEYGKRAIEHRAQWEAHYAQPFIPVVSVGWDNSPRYPDGPGVICHYNNTPRAFGTYLQKAKEYADAHADRQPRMVLINAWNEWVEGSYLLPDHLNGFGYLEAVRDVFGPARQ